MLGNNSDRPGKEQGDPLDSLLPYYLFKWLIISPTLHTYFRGRIYGAEELPISGSLIVVSNHASYFDPPILGACVRRPVAFMAKEELFKIPILKQGIELYGAYPVKRNATDLSAIRAAVKILDKGRAVGIFLEGTRTPDGRIIDPKLGAAAIAAKTKAPLLPVSLWGTDKILLPGSSVPRSVPVTVRIGKLIEAPSSTKREELQEITEKCANVINIMHSLGR
jgi:1-acyl-sn-glycerol-3-phosphate acyltransferase